MNLEKIWVCYNKIVEFPSELTKLTNLQQIIAYENCLKRLPRGMSSLKKLSNLYLHQNPNLAEIPADEFLLTNVKISLKGTSVGPV